MGWAWYSLLTFTLTMWKPCALTSNDRTAVCGRGRTCKALSRTGLEEFLLNGFGAYLGEGAFGAHS